MEDRLGWAIVILTIAGIIHLMVALANVGAQTMNSDPEFLKAGPQSYRCKTPKGRSVQCNKWITVAKRGWKKSCTEPGQTVLSGLSDPSDASIMLGEDATAKQCTMLFDEAWADYRRVDIKNKKKQAKEDARELRPAEFHQFVEVKEAGNYELSSCMVREVLQFGLDPELHSLANVGGITVSLIQWHKETRNQPTIHVILPEKKARFGVAGTLNGAQDFDLIVENYDDHPDHGEVPIDTVVGLPPHGKPVAEAHVHNVAGIWGFDGFGKDIYYVDGFNGHAGLENKYQGGGYNIDYADGTSTFNAEWSCYSAVRSLNPGFYLLSAEIYPTWVNNPEDPTMSTADYFGFGAIKNIELRKVQ